MNTIIRIAKVLVVIFALPAVLGLFLYWCAFLMGFWKRIIDRMMSRK